MIILTAKYLSKYFKKGSAKNEFRNGDAGA
jgi:hypothetical protein